MAFFIFMQQQEFSIIMKSTILIISLLFGLISCKEELQAERSTNKKSGLISYAKNLSIEPTDDGHLVHIFNPEQKSALHLFLGPKKPKSLSKEYIYISTPINSMIVLSGTHIGMLAKLDELDKIIGVSNKNYIHNYKVLESIATGNIKDFGNEESIPFESIVKTKAEVLMYSGFNASYPKNEQLKQLGINCIANYDWKEVHPLGKAEWIKLFGLLTGKYQEAQSYFDGVEKSYHELASDASKYKIKPTVLSGNLIGDIWYTPAGESYNATLIKDAGAKYVYASTKGTGSIELSLETVISNNQHTDFWINPGFPTIHTLQTANPKSRYLDASKNDKIYCYSKQMNKFWELSAIEPHHVLSDLIAIFHHKTDKQPLYFYSNIKE